MYKGMVFRKGGHFIQLCERMTHAVFEDRYDRDGHRRGDNIGWTYQCFNIFKKKWYDNEPGWMDEDWLKKEYEPIGRLATLVMFGLIEGEPNV